MLANSLSEPFTSEFENEACKMLTGYLYGVDPHLTKNSCATECRSLFTFDLFKFTKKLQSREFSSIPLFIKYLKIFENRIRAIEFELSE